MFRAWYDRVLRWAGHRHARAYLAGMSFIEAIFFPVPPDVMLAPMCLARPLRAWHFAAICTLASVLGGLCGYWLGGLLGEWIRPWLEQSRYAAAYQQVVASFEHYGAVYLLLAGFSPIPFKVFTVSAGLLGMPLLPFIAASAAGRAGRFFLVAGLIRLGGRHFAQRLRVWMDWIGWTTVVIAGVGLLLWWYWR